MPQRPSPPESPVAGADCSRGIRPVVIEGLAAPFSALLRSCVETNVQQKTQMHRAIYAPNVRCRTSLGTTEGVCAPSLTRAHHALRGRPPPERQAVAKRQRSRHRRPCCRQLLWLHPPCPAGVHRVPAQRESGARRAPFQGRRPGRTGLANQRSRSSVGGSNAPRFGNTVRRSESATPIQRASVAPS